MQKSERREKKTTRERFNKKERKEKFKEEKEILFNPQFCQEQQDAFDALVRPDPEIDIGVFTGVAGTGKTHTACAIALYLLLQNKIESIFLTRPMISTESVGYLKGDLSEKYMPWLLPLTQNFKFMYSEAHIDAFLAEGKINMLPIQFIRGFNVKNSVLIVDEAENLTAPQLKLILTRIDIGSKILLCGDVDQCDLRNKMDSGLESISNFKVNGLAHFEFIQEHRKQIIIDILNEFKKLGY